MDKNVGILAVILLSITLACGICRAQQTLRGVTVTANRPLREIGVQKTRIDSAALKENIALSMADILTYNSSIFVKSYGRATMSTVSFRGTSPSHTQVTWNGMRISSPMLGMTDFSTIPAYFIDDATLLHGSSSVNDTGGGLGGLVKLGTTGDAPEGFHARYIQGVGSFRTFDEFLRVTYANDHWTTSTRAVLSTSPNDYTYINHDKKLNIYDDDHNIIGQYHPKEKNRSGAFRDLHLLQEVYYDNLRGDRLALKAWYIDSNRELPMLSTDYGHESSFENRQREQTFRGILSWNHSSDGWSTDVRCGYIHTWMAYDYRREVGIGAAMAAMTRSRSHVNTIYGQAEGSWMSPNRKWLISGNITAHQHFVRSADRNIIMTDGDRAIVGYDKARIELTGSASARWQPIDRLGLSAVLRQDMFGYKWAPLIPAFFVDAVICRPGNITAKASVSRNYRFPSLNDLYFLPGGNPKLRSERGFTYDCGISFDLPASDRIGVSGNVNWFDSYINDWILWLPTTKGFFSPRNVKDVHAYGIESQAALKVLFLRDWKLDLSGTYSWTPSINQSEPASAADKSVGKQLPYVPRHSASVTGHLGWRRCTFMYQWAYYSERFTQSSNEATLTGKLPPYYMSNISLGYFLPISVINLDFKLAVNNLFNEDYLSVLSRPMPGINFEFFVSVSF